MYELITIRFSHFNEKARWALDRFGVPYRERGYMPLFHFWPTAMAMAGQGVARADRASTRFSTPLLINDTGRRIQDSAEILRYVSTRHAPQGQDLYPTHEVAPLEQRLGRTLGPYSRRVAYGWIANDGAALNWMADHNVDPGQAKAFRIMSPVVRLMLRRALGVTPERVERARDRVRECFDEISERLSDGRPYLIGDRFSAADLTFAALAVPAVFITHDDGYGALLPSPDGAPAWLREDVERLRETPAGQHALRMYREERGPLA